MEVFLDPRINSAALILMALVKHIKRLFEHIPTL